MTCVGAALVVGVVVGVLDLCELVVVFTEGCEVDVVVLVLFA